MLCSLGDICSLGRVLDNLLIFLLNVAGWFSHQCFLFLVHCVAHHQPTLTLPTPPNCLAKTWEKVTASQALEGSPLVEGVWGEGGVSPISGLPRPIKPP